MPKPSFPKSEKRSLYFHAVALQIRYSRAIYSVTAPSQAISAIFVLTTRNYSDVSELMILSLFTAVDRQRWLKWSNFQTHYATFAHSLLGGYSKILAFSQLSMFPVTHGSIKARYQPFFIVRLVNRVNKAQKTGRCEPHNYDGTQHETYHFPPKTIAQHGHRRKANCWECNQKRT